LKARVVVNVLLAVFAALVRLLARVFVYVLIAAFGALLLVGVLHYGEIGEIHSTGSYL
jgi:hypothetical protein